MHSSICSSQRNIGEQSFLNDLYNYTGQQEVNTVVPTDISTRFPRFVVHQNRSPWAWIWGISPNRSPWAKTIQIISLYDMHKCIHIALADDSFKHHIQHVYYR